MNKRCPVCKLEAREVYLINTSYYYCDQCKEDIEFLSKNNIKIDWSGPINFDPNPIWKTEEPSFLRVGNKVKCIKPITLVSHTGYFVLESVGTIGDITSLDNCIVLDCYYNVDAVEFLDCYEVVQ